MLFVEGATVPFIARYRKEVTGNMNELKIIQLQDRLRYYQALEERKETILRSIEEQGKLDEELRQRIQECFHKSELEDLYLPFKPKRQTKASVAVEKGLEPLARFLKSQEPGEASIEEVAAAYVLEEKGVTSVEDALEGALHIVAEWISDDAEVRRFCRTVLIEEGSIASRPVQEENPPSTKYDMYYKFRDTVAKIPSHRLLAVMRGAKEGVLHYTIESDEGKPLAFIGDRLIREKSSSFSPYLERAAQDAYRRLLIPSLHHEVFERLKEQADSEAIRVFQQNLSNLLLQPPAGGFTVMGVDPGLRTGCKLAVVDETGRYLDSATIFPHQPKQDLEGATNTLLALMARFNASAIAFGNGTGSRETETFLRKVLEENHLEKVLCVSVNEAGASVYSTSQTARDEFPDMDPTIRSAVSIARRLQDPLAELVKVEPKSIGVGQYQHDVDQKHLRESLAQTVISCVNHVGVNLNTSSRSLLRYVSGLNSRQAKNIIEFRNQNGPFRTRQAIHDVPGLGPKTFEQAAGFLRIPDGENPLDRTAVHPESYPVVEKMSASLGIGAAELVGSPEWIAKLNLADFISDTVGMLTLEDIREELLKPGRDPREQFTAAHFREDVQTVEDLEEGMILEGTVSNVANFGAFVDIGVHHDGLVHISQLSNRFVKDPCRIIKVGDVVKVKVVGVDKAQKRISLSIRALLPELPKPEKRPARPAPPAPGAAAEEGKDGVPSSPRHRRRRPRRNDRPKAAAAPPEAVVERKGPPRPPSEGAPERPRERAMDKSRGKPRDRFRSGSPEMPPREGSQDRFRTGFRDRTRGSAREGIGENRQLKRVLRRPAQPTGPMITSDSPQHPNSQPSMQDMSMEERIALLQAKFRPIR